jgi:hypothetical protein
MGEIKGSSLIILRITILYFLLSIGHPWFYLKMERSKIEKEKTIIAKKQLRTKTSTAVLNC